MFVTPQKPEFFVKTINTYCNTYYNYTIKSREAVNISSDEAVVLIKSNGWYEVGQTGSHKHFKHPSKPGRTTIPMGYKDLNIKTRNSILKQAGLK
jgi:predicted RNA binding protein YcfA (HicA-like mRNA interferase family)